ncbi:MAG: hypothetical protein WC712_08125 [Candidatus Brocadiia bacterium]
MNTRTTTLPRALLLFCLILTLCGFGTGEEPTPPPKPQTIVWSLPGPDPSYLFDIDYKRFEIPSLYRVLSPEIVGMADLLNEGEFQRLEMGSLWGVTVGQANGSFKWGAPVSLSGALDSVTPYIPQGVSFRCKTTSDDIRTIRNRLPKCRYIGTSVDWNNAEDLALEVSKCESLEFLELGQGNLGEAGVKSLSRLKALKALILTSSSIETFSRDTLYDSVSQMSDLRYLRLRSVDLDPSFAEVVGKLKSLESLCVASKNVSSIVTPLLATSSLKRVIFESQTAEKAVAQLPSELKGISDLGLYNFDISSDALSVLSRSEGLTSLGLWNCTLPDEDIGFPKSLRTLVIDQSDLPKRCVRAIGQLPNLENLWISLSPDNSAEFLSLQMPTTLKRLFVAASPDELPALEAKLGAATGLREAALMIYLGGQFNGKFADLAANPSLVSLQLICSVNLGDLLCLKNLESLVVGGKCIVAKPDPVPLADMKSLRTLVLKLPAVPDGFWDAIAKMPALEKVEIHAPLPQAELDAKRAGLHAANPKLKFIGLYSSLMLPQ